MSAGGRGRRSQALSRDRAVRPASLSHDDRDRRQQPRPQPSTAPPADSAMTAFMMTADSSPAAGPLQPAAAARGTALTAAAPPAADSAMTQAT
jgi:hypothetical protein